MGEEMQTARDIATLQTETKHLGSAHDELRAGQLRLDGKVSEFAVITARFATLLENMEGDQSTTQAEVQKLRDEFKAWSETAKVEVRADVNKMGAELATLKKDDVSLRRQRLVLAGTVVSGIIALALFLLGKLF